MYTPRKEFLDTALSAGGIIPTFGQKRERIGKPYCYPDTISGFRII